VALNVALTAHDRRALRHAAQLIDNGAESLKQCSTVVERARGRPDFLRWDSASDRKAYEREKRIAKHLRDLAHGISHRA
jgi:hypothetical protein